MTATLQTLGCVGGISNDPDRDIDEIWSMESQYLLTGVSPGHEDMVVHAVNIPVLITGMDVAPSEIIHMDENGAVKFPAGRLDEVIANVKVLVGREDRPQQRVEQASSAADVREVFQEEVCGEADGE